MSGNTLFPKHSGKEIAAQIYKRRAISIFKNWSKHYRINVQIEDLKTNKSLNFIQLFPMIHTICDGFVVFWFAFK